MKTQPLTQAMFGPRKDTLIVWLGMAGALINTRGTVLLIDPLLTSIRRQPGVELAETGHRLKLPWPIRADRVPRADALLYTHADADHFGMTTAHTLAHRTHAPIIAPGLVLNWLNQMDLDNTLLEAREKHTIQIGPARIVITPALHDYPCEYPFARKDCVGYLIETADGTIWHPGDSSLLPELAKYTCDIMFFDVADIGYHLGPKGSAALARSSGARLLIPYHYDTFDMPRGSWGGCLLNDARPALKGLKTPLPPINPGQPIRLSRGQIKFAK